MPSFPGVKAEILLDAPNDPAGAGVWIDVTPYLVSWSTKRGRQDETTDVGPETMQWKLRNTDGRFDPFNPGTPYYPNLKVNRQARMTLTWPVTANLLDINTASMETDGSGWVLTAGTSLAQTTAQAADGTHSMALTNNGSSGSAAALATRVAVTAGAQYTALASFRAATTGRSCRVDIGWYNAGGTLISTSTGGSVSDTTSGWTQASNTATAPALTTTALITVVAPTSAASAGEVHYFDKASLAAGSSTTWTPGNITYPLFRGYEDTGWPQVYEARGRYGYCTPTFVTALSFLSNVDLLDCVLQEMLVDAPLALYPLSDGAGASQAGNISAFKLANAGMTPGSPITVGPVGSFAFGAVGVIPSASGLSATQFVGPTAGTSFGPNLLLPSSAMPSLTAGASFEFFFEISQTPTATSSLIAQVSGPSGGSIGVTYVSTSTTSGTINLTNQSPGGSFGSVTGPIVIVGQFAHVVVTLDVALTTATLWVNGNNAGSGVTAPAWTAGTLASVAAGGVTIPTGVTLSLGPVATYAKVLSATRIAAHYQAGMTAFWGESAGNRIKRLLSYASWLPALQSIDTTSDGDSNTPLLGATDLNGTNVTAAMQQVANSVLGDLDVTGDGKVRYRARDYRLNQRTAACTFGENTAGGEIAYTAAPNIGQKRDQLVGGVIVKQRDGITAVRGNAQAVLDGNGVKSYDVILANPVQVIDFADEMLRRYKDGHERIESVELNPIGDSTMWPSVLGIDFGSRVRTMRRPNGTYTKQIDGYVESIAHDVTVDFDGGTTWKTTLTGSPLAPGNPFILDVSLLDSADVLTF